MLAISRTYRPHRVFKWQRHLLAEIDVASDNFAGRLGALWQGPPRDALRDSEVLLSETLGLAGRHSGADLKTFRSAFAESRQPADAPGPETAKA